MPLPHLGRVPVIVTTNIAAPRVLSSRHLRIHQGRRLFVAQTTLEIFISTPVVGLQSVVEDDVTVAPGAVGHVVEGGCIFLRSDVLLRRTASVDIEAGLGLRSTVVAGFAMQTTVGKHDVAIASGTVARICHVLRVESPINRAHHDC